MAFEDVAAEVLAKREEQDKKFGPGHDDQHDSDDWYEILDDIMLGLSRDQDLNRKLFVDVAAVAMAAVESMDRKKANAGR